MNKEEITYVTKASLPKYEKYCEKIKQIWETHLLTNNGILHNELEKELAKFLETKNVTLYTNGHLSLENAIQLLDLKGEVITTPFTFISTTHAIARNGLMPVFCDINYEDYTIDVDKIEDLITPQTSAIIPVHVYGNVCNVEKIEEIAKKHNLKVIYDAAHAFGVKYKNQSIANYGDISMFSFHATKVFNTIEGGCLSYYNDNYRIILDRLKNFGIKDEDNIDYIGGNAKMNEFQAAMGLCNLEDIEENILKRKYVYECYTKYLKNIKGIKIHKIQENVESNYAYFPILIQDEYSLTRDELYDKLKDNSIYARKYFYPISNNTICYKNCKGKTPIAVDVSKRILTLPIYPDLEEETVKKICEIINNKKQI